MGGWRPEADVFKAMGVVAEHFPEGGLAKEYQIYFDLKEAQCATQFGNKYLDFVVAHTGARVKFERGTTSGTRTIIIGGHLVPIYEAHMLLMARYLDTSTSDAATERLRSRLEALKGEAPSSWSGRDAREGGSPGAATAEAAPRERAGAPQLSSEDAEAAKYDVVLLRRLRRHAEEQGWLQLAACLKDPGRPAPPRSRSRGQRARQDDRRGAQNPPAIGKYTGSSGHKADSWGGGGSSWSGSAGRAGQAANDDRWTSDRGENKAAGDDRWTSDRDGSKRYSSDDAWAPRAERRSPVGYPDKQSGDRWRKPAPRSAAEPWPPAHGGTGAGAAEPTSVEDAGVWSDGSVPGGAAAPQAWDSVATSRVDRQDGSPDGGTQVQSWGCGVHVQTWGYGVEKAFAHWDDAQQAGYLMPQVHGSLAQINLTGPPTPVQSYAIPVMAFGKDLILEAPPGSGKTTAYALSLISGMIAVPPVERTHVPGPGAQAQPVALVLAPTREVVMASSARMREVVRWSQTKFMVLALHKQEALDVQMKPIQNSQFDIVCATPQRLLEVIDAGRATLVHVSTLVLDAADRLLSDDPGHVDQCLCSRDMQTPAMGRRTLMFAPAVSNQAMRYIKRWMRPHPDLVSIRVTPRSAGEPPPPPPWASPDSVTDPAPATWAAPPAGGPTGLDPAVASAQQRFEWVEHDAERWPRIADELTRLLQDAPPQDRKALVFVDRSFPASTLLVHVGKCNLSSGHWHLGLEQERRQELEAQFASGAVQVMVVTGNGGGRMLDEGLGFHTAGVVVQAELPATIQVYKQRLSFCAEGYGVCVSYVSTKDTKMAWHLVDFVKQRYQEPPSWLVKMIPPY